MGFRFQVQYQVQAAVRPAQKNGPSSHYRVVPDVRPAERRGPQHTTL